MSGKQVNGYEYKEAALSVGTDVTVLGRVRRDPQNGLLVLSRPFVISRDGKEGVLQASLNKNEWRFWIALGLASAGAAVAGAVVWKYYHHHRVSTAAAAEAAAAEAAVAAEAADATATAGVG